MSVATVAELRRIQTVSSLSVVVHARHCGQLRRIVRGDVHPVGDDPRYFAGLLRPGECCGAIVPTPDAPPDEPGWKHGIRAEQSQGKP